MKYLFSTLLFIFAVSDANADPVEIVEAVCSGDSHSLTIKYLADNDDFFSEPNSPAPCRLSKAHYSITAARGEFSQSGQCGAQPPVSVAITRNSTLLISDVIFGDNCFMGPAVNEIQITEHQGKLTSLKLCILEQPGADAFCRELRKKGLEVTNRIPIKQSDLDTFIKEHHRSRQKRPR